MNQQSITLGTIFLAAAIVLQLLPERGAAADDLPSRPKLHNQPSNTRPITTLPALNKDGSDRTFLEEEDYDPGYWELEPRPFAVSKQSKRFAWTSEDGRRSKVIRQLASNPDEVKRMEEENDYVVRRQLVYLGPEFEKEVTEIYDGKRKDLVIPGFDGEEFPVVVDHVVPSTLEGDDVGPLSGHFRGQVEGRPDAIVDVGSFENNWAIRVVTSETTYNQIESRRLGEFIISEVDTVALNQSDPYHCSGGDHVDSVGKIIRDESLYE